MSLSFSQAVSKAARYCSRQERCHQELRDKLFQWGVFGEEAESVIAELIEKNFLSESRFAEAYALGKFRQKSWGKRKIKQGLFQKRIPEVLIKEGLRAIEDDEYEQTILRIATKRAMRERSLDAFTAKQRVINFVVSKGFEPELVREIIDREGI